MALRLKALGRALWGTTPTPASRLAADAPTASRRSVPPARPVLDTNAPQALATATVFWFGMQEGGGPPVPDAAPQVTRSPSPPTASVGSRSRPVNGTAVSPCRSWMRDPAAATSSRSTANALLRAARVQAPLPERWVLEHKLAAELAALRTLGDGARTATRNGGHGASHLDRERWWQRIADRALFSPRERPTSDTRRRHPRCVACRHAFRQPPLLRFAPLVGFAPVVRRRMLVGPRRGSRLRGLHRRRRHVVGHVVRAGAELPAFPALPCDGREPGQRAVFAPRLRACHLVAARSRNGSRDRAHPGPLRAQASGVRRAGRHVRRRAELVAPPLRSRAEDADHGRRHASRRPGPGLCVPGHDGAAGGGDPPRRAGLLRPRHGHRPAACDGGARRRRDPDVLPDRQQRHRRVAAARSHVPSAGGFGDRPLRFARLHRTVRPEALQRCGRLHAGDAGPVLPPWRPHRGLPAARGDRCGRARHARPVAVRAAERGFLDLR